MKDENRAIGRKCRFLVVDLFGIMSIYPIVPFFTDTQRTFLRGKYTSVKVGQKRKCSAVSARYI